MAGQYGVFALISILVFSSSVHASIYSLNQTDTEIFTYTVTYYVRPGTNRLPLIPYENAVELQKSVDYISWYKQDQGANKTWIGGGRVDENEWWMSVATDYEERYSVLRGNGTLEIRNVTIHDDGALYLATVIGSYRGQLQFRLKYFDPNAEISNGNLTSPCNYSKHNNCTLSMDHIEPQKEAYNGSLTSPCNCSEHSNCTSPVDHIDPPKEASNGSLTSPCNCSEHSNCTSPVDHIDPPKEKCIGWIVAFTVILFSLLYCRRHDIVNIAERIFIIGRHWYTDNFPAAVGGGQINVNTLNGVEMRQGCDSQMREGENELLPHSVPEAAGHNGFLIVPGNGGNAL